MKKSEVKSHCAAKRALEVAAAGDHSILLVGPRGVGKSTLIEAYPEASRATARDFCLCGGDNLTAPCVCGPVVSSRWRRRLMRLADEQDIVIEVSPVPVKEQLARFPDDRADELFTQRVTAAREFSGANTSMDLDAAGLRTYEMVARRCGFNVGRMNRIMAVSRTIANLGASPQIQAKHIAEATQYSPYWMRGHLFSGGAE